MAGAFSGGIFTISGAPTAVATPGIYNYTVETTGGCVPNVSLSGSITVQEPPKITLQSGSATQSVCQGINIVPIIYRIDDATAAAVLASTPLPAGVTGVYSGGLFTISGAPTAAALAGIYNYTVETSGGCAPNVSLSGSITVNDVSKISLDATSASATQSVCQTVAILPIKYKIEGSAT